MGLRDRRHYENVLSNIKTNNYDMSVLSFILKNLIIHPLRMVFNSKGMAILKEPSQETG